MRPLLLLLLSLVLPVASQAATIWTGPTVSFTKSAFADPTDPANRDLIIPGVVEITRGDIRGLYNFAQEPSYSTDFSPSDTEWAFTINNPGVQESDITASNFMNLSFDAWEVAHAATPFQPVGEPSVLHIISEDIYIDLTFTSWGIGSGAGGGFSYERSTIPEPSTAALVFLGLLALTAHRRR